MTKLKKFRFLFKCFGLIGAICISLGLLDLKNVNAQNVNNTPRDLSDYNNSTYFNNGNKPIWETIDNSQLSSFSYNFNCYYNEEMNIYELVNIPVDSNFVYYITVFHKEINTNYQYKLGCSYTLFLADNDYSEINSQDYFTLLDCSYVSGTSNLIDTYELIISNEALGNYLKNFGVNQIGLTIKNLDFYIIPSTSFDISYIEVGVLPSDYFDIALAYASSTYTTIYDFGYYSGYDDALENVKTNQYNGLDYSQILQNGYNQGYNAGASSVNETNVVIGGLFGSIANVPLTILNGLFPATILGVPIITVLLTFLGILVIIWLIKRLI